MGEKVRECAGRVDGYVHVRSYKIVGGKKLYSGWSKAKSVKAK